MRDAWLVPLINCGTSFLAGIVVFSILGYMAHLTGQGVEEVVQGGTGLAFVVYPEALAAMPGAPIFSVLTLTLTLAMPPCLLPPASLPPASYHLLLTTCSLLPAPYYLLPTTCSLLPAPYYLLLATHYSLLAAQVLFFTMLLCLGLDTQFAMVETLMAALHDIPQAANTTPPPPATPSSHPPHTLPHPPYTLTLPHTPSHPSHP